jgi:hypothetical protein
MDENTHMDEQNGDIQLRNRLEDLPEEVLEIIRLKGTPQFLGTLAQKALNPTLTLRLFTKFDNVFADTCARFCKNTSSCAAPVDVPRKISPEPFIPGFGTPNTNSCNA